MTSEPPCRDRDVRAADRIPRACSSIAKRIATIACHSPHSSLSHRSDESRLELGPGGNFGNYLLRSEMMLDGSDLMLIVVVLCVVRIEI